MDYERVAGLDGIEVLVPKNEDQRTCAEYGGDCLRDPSITVEGERVRIAFVCPIHGVQTLVDPFEHLR